MGSHDLFTMPMKNGDIFDVGESSEAASTGPTPLDAAKARCKICSDIFKDPRVISCLHVFCKACIEKKLIGGSGDAGDAIVCPVCQQETKIGSNGVSALLRDYVTIKLINSSGLDAYAQACTSCDSEHPAISSCQECALYLCEFCHKAHKTIRCLKEHNVVEFREIQQNGSSDKEPIGNLIFCEVHPTMKLRVFCSKCEIVACSKCICSDHMDHHDECRGIEEVVAEQKEKLETSIKETKSKIEEQGKAVYAFIDKAWDELKEQQDRVKAILLKKYTHYKDSLDRCYQESIDKVNSLYEEQRLKISGTFNKEVIHSESVEKTNGKIDTACEFTSQLLTHGNPAEILYLKPVISAQLRNINSKIRLDCLTRELKFDLAFVVAISEFDKSVQKVFRPTTPTSSATLQGVKGEQKQNPDVGSDGNYDSAPSNSQGSSYYSSYETSESVTGNSENSEETTGTIKEELRSDGCSEEEFPTKPEERRWKVGKPGENIAEFNSPQGLCVDRHGDIYVADTNNHRVQVFDGTLKFKFLFGKQGRKSGELFYPQRIAAFKHAGNVVLSDHRQEYSRLQIFTTSGIFVRSIFIGWLVSRLGALTVSEGTGNIVCADLVTRRIHTISEHGQFLSSIDCSAVVSHPSDIAIFPAGINSEMYICDRKSHAIVSFRNDRGFAIFDNERRQRACTTTGVDYMLARLGSNPNLSRPYPCILVAYMDDLHMHATLFGCGGEELAHCMLPEIPAKFASAVRLTPSGDVVALSTNENFLLLVKMPLKS